MFRALRAALIGAVAALVLCGSSCSDSPNTNEPGSDSAVTRTGPISYDTFLAVLAENGWIPNEDQKLVGGVDKGVEVTVLGCHTRLGLIDSTKIDYHVYSVNGFGPDYYGDTAEKQLSVTNITRTEYENKLFALTDEGVISHC